MSHDPAYLELRYSGGAANSDPALSLGGTLSTNKVESQSATGTMAGVTVVDAYGNPTGNGSLTYTHNGGTNPTLEWAANGETAFHVEVMNTSGRYTLRSSGLGGICLDVTASALPTADQSQTFTIADLAEKFLPDVGRNQSYFGDDDYFCFYLKNTKTLAIANIRLFVETDASGPDSLQLGLDPAAENQLATAVPDRYTAPLGVTFGTYDGPTNCLNFSLSAGGFKGFWVKRAVPALVGTEYPNDTAVLGILQG